MSTAIRERLKPLIGDTDLHNLDDYIGFFRQSEDVEGIKQAMRDSEKEWGAGYNQTVGPIFQILYKQDETIKQSVNEQMIKLGVPEQAIIEYFTTCCHIGGPALSVGNIGKMIPDDKKEPFLELSNQLMLTFIRGYLGLEQLG